MTDCYQLKSSHQSVYRTTQDEERNATNPIHKSIPLHPIKHFPTLKKREKKKKKKQRTRRKPSDPSNRQYQTYQMTSIFKSHSQGMDYNSSQYYNSSRRPQARSQMMIPKILQSRI